MVASIHHVNFIVHDLDTALSVWERVLGRPVDRRDELPERGVRGARFRLGESWLVLVQPTRPDSVPGRYLAEHGEGFFLLSLGVSFLDAEIARLGEDHFAGPPRRGVDQWLVRDLDPTLTGGVQLQLTEEQVCF